MNPILEVRDLHVSFDTHEGEVQAVRGVSFDLYEGETLAIVGESGSGKTVTVQSLLGLIPQPPGRIKKGSIRYRGRELTRLRERELDKIRGAEIGYVFQDPMTALNPTMTIGRQISEVLVKHRKIEQGEGPPARRPFAPFRGDSESFRAAQALSPSVQRGDAPKGDDRHGTGGLSQGADCG